MKIFEEILKKCEEASPSPNEALFLLKETEDEQKALKLFEVARKVREKELGNVFNFSGGIARVLRCNLKPLCNYCPYWRDKNEQPLSINEILKAVDYIHKHGFKEFHLSGGTTLGSEGKDVLEIVKAIRSAGYTDMDIEVNCGASMSLDTLKALKSLGVTKVGAVFETINPVLFKKMKPGDNLEEKKKFANLIGEAGLQLGTGILVGISSENEKYQDYVDFAFHVKEYSHLKSVYVCKFFPFKGIALKDYKPCSNLEAARVISLLRLILRNKDIQPAQGWLKDEYPNSLMAGAGNKAGGIHINRTPHYKVEYAQRNNCHYEDNLEYFNTMDATREMYKNYGITVI